MTIAKNSNLIPSICKIFFAPLDDLDAISSSPDRFHRYIYFKTGKSWQPIYFTPGSAEFVEKPKDNDSGELIEQSLKFIFPGEDSGNLASLDAILNRPSVVKLQYPYGTSKLLGDLGNGAKLSQILQVSSKAYGSQLEFSCMATYRACWISE